MRVAMIAPPWLPIPPDGYGGIENVLLALVPELIKLGVHVELFTTGDTTLKASKKHWLYKTGQYEHIHRPQYDTVPILSAHMQFAINTILEDGKFDIIHDHNNFVGPLSFAHATPELPPVVHTLHNPRFIPPDLEKNTLDNIPMWKQLSTAKRLYFVSLSKAMQKTAPRILTPLMLPKVHNGIDVDSFPFEDKKSDYFITLARFHPEKGQAIAVRACAELEYQLKMAGVIGDITSPRKLLLELANPLSSYRSIVDFRYFSDQIFPYTHDGNIEYVGEVRGERKLQFVSKAKALLFPIQWEEPFGMAPIEALACGTPVVAMARGALPEIIQHGVNGFLAKTKSEFKKYMQRVNEIDPAVCRASVQEYFSAEVMAREYLDRYKLAIERAKQDD